MTAPATADDVVLDRLRPHIDEITTPSDRSVGFHPKTWRPWLASDPTAADLLDELGGDGHGASVDRSCLAELASQLGTDHADGHVRLFTATMIWGSGTRNGRGPRNTCRALRAPSLAATLRLSAALVTHEDFASAYVAARLPGVGPAFFTKWLWAVGLARPRPPRPLILDSLVWASLARLGWNSRDAAGSSRWADRYVAYVSTMHRWATQLDAKLPADRLEYFRFQRRRDEVL